MGPPASVGLNDSDIQTCRMKVVWLIGVSGTAITSGNMSFVSVKLGQTKRQTKFSFCMFVKVLSRAGVH